MPQQPTPGTEGNLEPALVVQRMYDLNKWIIERAEKFPRAHKFSLGDRLVSTSLDILMGLVDATYSRRKSQILEECALRMNRLRYLIRICKDLDVLAANSYEYASLNIEEIGRMVGGWRKWADGR